MAEEVKKKTVTRVESKSTTAAKKTVTKAVETEEAPKTEKKATPVEAKGGAGGKRLGAVICWVLALGCEIFGILTFVGKIYFKPENRLTVMIIALVVDLILVIIGSALWKKANRIDPASKKNKVKFFLWNNMGVIACIVCFLPIIILLFAKKDELDEKSRKIAIIAAIAALVIGGACSVDYNPVSAEEKAEAEAVIESDVFWTRFGHVYHTHEDCGALKNSAEIFTGDVDTAIENNRTKLCSFCAKKDGITTVVTDNADTGE